MTDAPPDTKLDIDWLKTLAGALAAVTTAVLLSTLGAAGTLIGAALGSVAATVGTALYTQGLATSRHKVAKVQENALQKVGIAQAEVRRASRRRGDGPAVEAHLEHAEEQLAEAQQELDDAVDGVEPPGWGARLAALSWKRVGLVAGGTFVVVVLALVAFELVGGKPVSSYTGGTDGSGGTSISRLTGSGGQSGGGDGDRDGGGRQQDRDDPQPSDAPTGTPSDGTSDDPVDTPTPSEEPTQAPSEEPAESPTGDPGGTSVPSPTEPAPPTSSPTG